MTWAKAGKTGIFLCLPVWQNPQDSFSFLKTSCGFRVFGKNDSPLNCLGLNSTGGTEGV